MNTLITNKGAARAREQMERTSYVGPTPVSWDDYIAAIDAQKIKKLTVNPSIMKKKFVPFDFGRICFFQNWAGRELWQIYIFIWATRKR
ncbi:MAG: hypothetical protein M5U34_21565 [Chloroflexi bacterium]|nr:hypothetical protein [Chloroflexota bacterium]